MNAYEIGEMEALCIQEETAYCTAECPVHVNVRALMSYVNKGSFEKAFKSYAKQVKFPRIISRVCDEPCRAVCIRKKLDDSLAVRLIEKACVDYTVVKRHNRSGKVKKSERIAVIGGGLSGLSCSVELVSKGYDVTLYEKTERLGGRLWDFDRLLLPAEIITNELSELEGAGVRVCLNSAVVSLSELDFEAVYVGTGIIGESFALTQSAEKSKGVDPVSLATSMEGVFVGGSMLVPEQHYSPIYSVSQGVRAGKSIDRYFRKLSLSGEREKEGSYQTRLYTDIRDKEIKLMVPVNDSARGYSEAGAKEEAARCLQCDCKICVKTCCFLESYSEYPKSYVKNISKSLTVIPTMGTRFASRLVNSCSVCGLCKEVCVTKFDMGVACLDARKIMVEQGDMPAAFHDFFLRDMMFANSEQSFLVRQQPGAQACSYLFFPGCQLSASSPGNVEKAYKYLMTMLPGGVGLMLGCCGAPAEWSGRTEVYKEQLQQFQGHWESLGRPKVILSCPTCIKMFKEYLPEVPVQSLWGLIAQVGFSRKDNSAKGLSIAVYDPCSSRYDPESQGSVRKILKELGCDITELPLHGIYAQCCSYGGLIQAVNPELANQITNQRISASHLPYVTYCINCRNDFAAKGKPVWYLLDLLFGEVSEAEANQQVHGYTERRNNRITLKTYLLESIWGETMEIAQQKYEKIELSYSATIQEKMERELILLNEVKEVIYYAEQTGNKIIDTANNHFVAHLQLGIITYWAEYLPKGNAYEVLNVYAHRMQIDEKGS